MLLFVFVWLFFLRPVWPVTVIRAVSAGALLLITFGLRLWLLALGPLRVRFGVVPLRALSLLSATLLLWPLRLSATLLLRTLGAITLLALLRLRPVTLRALLLSPTLRALRTITLLALLVTTLALLAATHLWGPVIATPLFTA